MFRRVLVSFLVLSALTGCAAYQPTRYPLSSMQVGAGCTTTHLSDDEPGSVEAEAIEIYKDRVRAIKLENLDAPLQIVHMKLPDYPLQARKERIEGLVEVKFTVNEAGVVESPFLTKMSHPVLNRAAADAVTTWRFAPSYFQGKPTKVRLKLCIPFILRSVGTQHPFADSLPTDRS